MKITIKIIAKPGFKLLRKKYLPTSPYYNLNTCGGDGYRRIKRENAGSEVYYLIQDVYLKESSREYDSNITKDEYFDYCKSLCQEYIKRLKGLKEIKTYIWFTDEYYDGRQEHKSTDLVFENGKDYTEEIF